MSIISRMRELESYDDASLINMIQQGNSRYPQYAVLGEIERRKDLRRIAQNQIAMQNQPTMSVADESVMQFAQGVAPVNTAPLISNVEVSASPAGLQGATPTMMEDGGITKMQSGRSTALEQSFMPPGRNPIPMSATASSNLRGGLSNIAESLGVIDAEGNIDPVQAALLGLTFIPGLGLVAGVGRVGLGAAKFLAPKVKSFFMKPNPVRSAGLQPGQRVIIDPKKGLDSKKLIDTATGKVIPEEVVNVGRVLGTAGTIASPFAISNIYAPDESTNVEKNELTEQEITANKSLQNLQDILSTPTDSTADTGREDSINTGLNIAQLAGVIGTAKNLGDVAGGMGELARQIQQQRTAKRESDTKIRLTETQIKKLESDIANIPLDAALTQYAAIPKLLETGAIEQADAIKLLESLSKRIAELQGITPTQSKSYDQFITS